MPENDRTEGAALQSPFCSELRSKKFFMIQGVATEAAQYLDGSDHCWCFKTQLPVGPDGGKAYPDRCDICDNVVCTCPPILPSTLGRIAHDVPGHRASFSEGGALLPIDEAMELFRRYSDHEFSVADCASFVIARRKKVREVFGFDRDFVTMGFVLRPRP